MTIERAIEALESSMKKSGKSPISEELDAAHTTACFALKAAKDFDSAMDLAMLTDDYKNKRIIRLPCKVGDTVWVKDRAGVPREMMMEEPDIRFACTDVCMAPCSRTPGGLCVYQTKNDGSDIGKKVFLTREEAEAAMGNA